MKMRMKNRSHRYDINRSRSRHEHNILDIKRVSVWWCLYAFSNTQATFDAQFMRKSSNTEAEMIQSIAYKKSVYTRYKMCLSIIIVTHIKHYLSNIWNSIHEKVKQLWDWVKKSVAYKKSL